MIAMGVASLVSLMGLLVFRVVAPRIGLVDKPGSRSQHRTPTLVGGGIAVALGALAGTVIMATSGPLLTTSPGVFVVIGAFLASVGLLDDRFELGSFSRLVMYFLSCAVFVLFEMPELPLLLMAFAVISLVWVINLFNFMDGLDGFAASQCLCVTIGMGLLASFGPSPSPPVALMSFVLAAATAPLLVFNWPPATLFMGDAGAVFMGFFLGATGLLAGLYEPSLGVAWLILMMPFLVDATGTLLLRLAQGYAPHHAHRDHMYQRLARRTGSALTMDLGLLALHGLWHFPLAVVMVNGLLPPVVAVLISVIPAISLMVYSRRTG